MHLKEKNESFAAKVLELRKLVESWLGYIPNTFPHYTRHTVYHSDEIVKQLSLILVSNEGLVLDLSSMELYILCTSALLHDVGMVVSDEAKKEVIKSEGWSEWCSLPGPSKRMKEIQDLRRQGKNREELFFLADLEFRFLLADYMRGSHHLRIKDFLSANFSLLSTFFFGDASLQKTICDVCISHGLNHSDILNIKSYPEIRTIMGEQVNVRLMSVLLRVGDLLDMSHDRSCPLLYNAASPIPKDSLAHWSQYNKIVHRAITPEKIELDAECDNQSEHSVLYDWCRWIEIELESINNWIRHSKRHNTWSPPRAAISKELNNTITIKPSKEATYIPCEWKFILDENEIVKKLISNIHSDGFGFLKELIQNSLDAIRCRIAIEQNWVGKVDKFDYLSLSREELSRYRIQVILSEEVEFDEVLQVKKKVQYIEIRDNGIGMNERIITQYFLQIGRSFYSSKEYSKKYNFSPSNKFGVGFLTCFNVSDEIEVKTFKVNEEGESNLALKLELSGPKQYILLSKVEMMDRGTSIKLKMNEPLEFDETVNYLRELCKRVEVEVSVSFGEKNETIKSEKDIEFTNEVINILNPEESFKVETFKIENELIHGEIYFLIRSTPNGDSWADKKWIQKEYPDLHPMAEKIQFPDGYVCINGLMVRANYSYRDSLYSFQVDYRGEKIKESLNRGQDSYNTELNTIDEVVKNEVEKYLLEHIGQNKIEVDANQRNYLQSLANDYLSFEFWRNLDGVIPALFNGERKHFSISEFLERADRFVVYCGAPEDWWNDRKREKDEAINFKELEKLNLEGIVLHYKSISNLNFYYWKQIFSVFEVDCISMDASKTATVVWKKTSEKSEFVSKKYNKRDIGARVTFEVVSFRDQAKGFIGLKGHKVDNDIYETLYLNSEHEFVRWLSEIKEEHTKIFHKVLDYLESPVRYEGHNVEELSNYLEKIKKFTFLSSKHHPPSVDESSFVDSYPVVFLKSNADKTKSDNSKKKKKTKKKTAQKIKGELKGKKKSEVKSSRKKKDKGRGAGKKKRVKKVIKRKK